MRPLKNVQFYSSLGNAKILTLPITIGTSRNIPVVFRGLEFEPDAEIGEKGAFFRGLRI